MNNTQLKKAIKLIEKARLNVIAAEALLCDNTSVNQRISLGIKYVYDAESALKWSEDRLNYLDKYDTAGLFKKEE